MTELEIAKRPIFFERNRVFRVYKGGKLLGKFLGETEDDGNYPEEWIASNVRALNRDSTDEHEGISRIRGTELYFDELLRSQKDLMLGGREELGILVKYLDSAIRLPLQTHPDPVFSRKYFSSDHGKAESWIILDAREGAEIFFGFQNAMTKEEFGRLVEETETNPAAMEGILYRIPVKKGDVFFVPARVAHAIGYGCFILEIQEPTDFTIQPEAWCGDYRLNDYEKYLGLKKDVALDCFDYDLYGEAAVKLGQKSPKLLEHTVNYRRECLIGEADTACFSVFRHKQRLGAFSLPSAPAIYIVTEGAGRLTMEGYEKEVRQGDYFFLPYAALGKCRVCTDGAIEMVECIAS